MLDRFALGLSVVPLWLWIVYAVLGGLSTGSFLNVVTWRLPRNESLLGRSRCPRCRVVIAWYDNIPVLSFLLLGVKCRACRAPISWRYPLVELATATIWGTTVWWFGPTPQAFIAGAALSILLVVSLIDIEHMIVPDLLTLALLATGLAAASLGWGPSLSNVLAAGAAGALLIGMIVVLTRGGMGTGDVGLAAALGANLGVVGLALALWLAFVIGGIVAALLLLYGRHSRKTAIPYGPFLAIGGAVALFATSHFTQWLSTRFLIALPY